MSIKEEIETMLKIMEKAHYMEIDAFGVIYVFVKNSIGGFTVDFDPDPPEEILNFLRKKFPENKQLREY